MGYAITGKLAVGGGVHVLAKRSLWHFEDLDGRVVSNHPAIRFQRMHVEGCSNTRGIWFPEVILSKDFLQHRR